MAVELPIGTANAVANTLANNLNAVTGLSSLNQDHICKANGVDGMNSFGTRPNSDYAIFDMNSDVFCTKFTDGSNVATMRSFSFQEITKEEAMRLSSPYLMKGELDSFKTDILAAMKSDILSAVKEEMNNFKEELLNGQQSIRNVPAKYSYNTGANNTSSADK